ncbi:MAG: dihydrofolate reductase [Candidatus Melainabacteria bacterium]|nr:dihydrofolate reductase [Candidatus Melainabacteria bacterium]
MVEKLEIVVAADLDNGIGKDNALPWRIPGDMKFFQSLTSATTGGGKNAIIVGRKTWESIPEKRRPLKDRLNVILTKNAAITAPEGVLVCNSLEKALKALQGIAHERCFIIGGAQIYKEALQHPLLTTIHLTRIMQEFDCDAHFPPIDDRFALQAVSDTMKENDIEYRFQRYEKKSAL